MDRMVKATLTVNGVRHDISASPDATLLWILRDQLQLTGTKYGCGKGECGACTVHLDGKPALACQYVLTDVGERAVTDCRRNARLRCTRPGPVNSCRRAIAASRDRSCARQGCWRRMRVRRVPRAQPICSLQVTIAIAIAAHATVWPRSSSVRPPHLRNVMPSADRGKVTAKNR
jgi:2Fe-2S iron-sulfur cluster binding domain